LTQIAELGQVGIVLAAEVADTALRPFQRAGLDVRRV
jgi:hypothetical protein